MYGLPPKPASVARANEAFADVRRLRHGMSVASTGFAVNSHCALMHMKGEGIYVCRKLVVPTIGSGYLHPIIG